MDNDYFLNSGIPTWQSRSPASETTFRSSDQSLDCLVNNHNWDNNFDSAFTSMPLSSAPSNGNFAIPELIGKLTNICNSGEITPQSHPLLAATAAFIGGGNGLSPKAAHYMKGNQPNSPMNGGLPAIGFAERAAKFSSFGSRSFNGRTTTGTTATTTATTQLNLKKNNNTESPCYGSNSLMANANLPRVSSTPSLVVASGSSSMASLGNLNCTQPQMQMMMMTSKNGSDTKFPIPNEESSPVLHDQKKQSSPSDSNSKKRKPSSTGKSPTQKCNSSKVGEAEEDEPNTKRSKTSEAHEKQEEPKVEDEQKPEPPKDYIHVRARRGQATDSHSLAERVRREKISERMKLLQDLVPGCNKVTGKALMLDEIINYVQSLQRQVEFLSMKVASVNTRPDFNMDGVFSKDVFQGNGVSAPPSFMLDSSMSSLFGQHPQVQNSIANKINSLQLPSNDEYSQGLTQFPTLCEDDLQSLVQMGFSQSQNQDSGFHQEGYPGTSQTSHMKLEL